MKDKLKVGIIGLGQRGKGLLEDVIINMEDIDVVAVCDEYEDRCEQMSRMVLEKKGKKPFTTCDYREVIALGDKPDAVVVSTSWVEHVKITTEAMRAGIAVGCEVGGAYTEEDCFDLVKTYEKTKTPCMMLENCCYARDEMMVLNMVRKGIFGKIVHCEGGYRHDLREEIASGRKIRHYRLDNYMRRNCDNYPTHALGPIAKILDINRGNRMLTLCSVSSNSEGMYEYLKNHTEYEDEVRKADFAQGDVITTTIKCAQGQTIVLVLDTTLPRPYSRGFSVHGTKGTYNEENKSVFLDGSHNEFVDDWTGHWNNAKEFYNEFDHPVWKEFSKDGKEDVHGGIDWLVLRAFFESVKYDIPMPINVYDMASWMCISALSEKSIAMGGAPVSFPDFTRGKWLRPLSPIKSTYSLDI